MRSLATYLVEILEANGVDPSPGNLVIEIDEASFVASRAGKQL